MSAINKEQTTLIVNGQGGAGSSPFFNKTNSKNNCCDLCGKYHTCLTPVDFSKMVWRQGYTLQAISENEGIKKFKIMLCINCNKDIFLTSVPCIRYRQELFEVLSK